MALDVRHSPEEARRFQRALQGEIARRHMLYHTDYLPPGSAAHDLAETFIQHIVYQEYNIKQIKHPMFEELLRLLATLESPAERCGFEQVFGAFMASRKWAFDNIRRIDSFIIYYPPHVVALVTYQTRLLFVRYTRELREGKAKEETTP